MVGSRRSVDAIRRRFYPSAGRTGSRDGTTKLYEWVCSIDDPLNSSALNIGAGSTTDEPRRLRGRFARHVGVDVDPGVIENADLDEAHQIDGIKLPFPDSTFDLVYSDWTLEHVASPGRLLDEIHRVLRPGGTFVFRTPNLFHYVSLIARVTPHRFHVFVGRRIRSSVLADPFPTFYRINSPRRVRRLLREAGFRDIQIETLEPEPSYLAFSRLAFLAGVAYERVLNNSRALRSLRHVILTRATR